MIVSYIEKVSCEVHQNGKMLGVPVRGYVATSRRVNRTEWEDSIRWCSTELEPLTWTKISGGTSESAAGISSSMIEMTSMIPRAQWACLRCGEHGAILTPKGPLGVSTVRLNCHPGQPNTVTSYK